MAENKKQVYQPRVNDIEYSVREQTQKNHSVQDAVDAAELLMRVNKGRKDNLNLKVLKELNLDRKTKITIVELNQLQAVILKDSGYYH